jgi:3-oxoacyl-(acyl-carrier-protein) synthase
MILSEGAGAILLARLPRRSGAEAGEGQLRIESAHPGGNFTKRIEAEKILHRIVRDLAESKIDLVISSANGTFVDRAEYRTLEQVMPNALVYTAKPALGESIGAAGVWQVILAAQALHSAELPPVLHADSALSLRLPLARMSIPEARRAIVLGCGLNQQAAGLRLAIK